MKFLTFNKVAPVVVAIILAVTFVELGIWQLHRAQESQQNLTPKKDLPVANLASLINPGENMNSTAVNRIVKTTGEYVLIYSAPNQEVTNVRTGNKIPETLEVRLLRIKPNYGILVVRGIEVSSSQEFAEPITVTGRLYPRQSENHSDPAENTLTRLDPSLIAGAQGLKLYDGYIIATSEKTEFGQPIDALRVPAPAAKSTTPGFYWQHVSYVFIWWLMALLVLLLPFYGRMKDRISA